MPTLNAGNSVTLTLAANQEVQITPDPAEIAIANVYRGSVLIGNTQVSTPRTLGPYLAGDVMVITAGRGDVDYTVQTVQSSVPGDGAADGADGAVQVSNGSGGFSAAQGLMFNQAERKLSHSWPNGITGYFAPYAYGIAWKQGGGTGVEPDNRLELYLGTNNAQAAELSVRHNGNNTGARIQARNVGDTDGIYLDFTEATMPWVRWGDAGPFMVKREPGKLALRNPVATTESQQLLIANKYDNYGGQREFVVLGVQEANRFCLRAEKENGGQQRPIDIDAAEIVLQIAAQRVFAVIANGLLVGKSSTSQHAGMKMAGATVQLRMADDSGYATIYAKLPTTNPGPGVLWDNNGVPAIGTSETNLLTSTNNFAASVWNDANTLVRTYLSTIGTMNRYRVQAVNAGSQMRQAVASGESPLTNYRAVWYLEAGTSTRSRVVVYDFGNSAQVVDAEIVWTAGVPSIAAGTTVGTWAQPIHVGDGIYEISARGQTGAAAPQLAYGVYPDVTAGAGNVIVCDARLVVA